MFALAGTEAHPVEHVAVVPPLLPLVAALDTAEVPAHWALNDDAHRAHVELAARAPLAQFVGVVRWLPVLQVLGDEDRHSACFSGARLLCVWKF